MKEGVGTTARSTSKMLVIRPSKFLRDAQHPAIPYKSLVLWFGI